MVERALVAIVTYSHNSCKRLNTSSPTTTFVANHNTSFIYSFAYRVCVTGYELRVASMLIGNNPF